MTTETATLAWERVRGALSGALAISWDGCHKIYLLMDKEQVKQSEDWGYEPVPVTDQEEALNELKQWFDCSCGLRFIDAVKTVEGDPNDGYSHLISQFEIQKD